jgi:hypothetical protein
MIIGFFKKLFGFYTDYHIWIEIPYEVVEQADFDLYSYYQCLRKEQLWDNQTIPAPL